MSKVHESKNISGDTPHKRAAFLREYGYEMAENGSGKGGHSIWVNKELRAMARKYGLMLPANLSSHKDPQPICTVMLCSSPARGTWAATVKKVLWAHNAVEAIRIYAERAEEERAQKSRIKAALKEKSSLCTEFRRAYKTGGRAAVLEILSRHEGKLTELQETIAGRPCPLLAQA